jgi:IclR family acetate operon transcriptional repressor
VATPKNRSVLKAFALLRAFQRPDEALTSAELSRRVGVPEASGYRLIQSLEAAGAVARDSRGRYVSRWTARSDDVPGGPRVSARVQQILEDLAARFGATAHAGVLERGMVTYVGKASAPSAVSVPTRLGAQQEAYCSALGKVLLAALEDPALDAYLREGELIALTENTITDPARFRMEIETVRARGFALDEGETHPQLACIAAPLRAAGGQIVAGISIVDHLDRMDGERREAARGALSEAARLAGEGQVFARMDDWSAALARSLNLLREIDLRRRLRPLSRRSVAL